MTAAKGTKRMALVDGQGLPLGVRLGSASPTEVKLAKATPAKVRVHGGAAFLGKKHRSERKAIAACSTVR